MNKPEGKKTTIHRYLVFINGENAEFIWSKKVKAFFHFCEFGKKTFCQKFCKFTSEDSNFADFLANFFKTRK
jgi:hypothetical protein